MNSSLRELIERPNVFRRLLNFWFPYLGAGIRVERISTDWREIDVAMRRRWFNRNYMGTHFGGSLYAMTDPFHVLMLIKNLGRDYWVWDLDARIRFVAPGTGTVRAHFHLPPETIAEIRRAAAGGEKTLEHFQVQVHDTQGKLVAEVSKTVYIRMKKTAQERPAAVPAGRCTRPSTTRAAAMNRFPPDNDHQHAAGNGEEDSVCPKRRTTT